MPMYARKSQNIDKSYLVESPHSLFVRQTIRISIVPLHLLFTLPCILALLVVRAILPR